MICLFFILSIVFAAPLDRVAAVVNNDVIALSEVYGIGSDYIKRFSQDERSRRKAELSVLETLIMRSLISQELERMKMTVTQEELDGALADVSRSNGIDVDRLKSEVEKSGMAWDQYLQEMRQSLSQMKFQRAILQPRITIDEDALLDLYQRKVSESPSERDLGAIFLSNAITPEEAETGTQLQARQEMVLGVKIEALRTDLDSGKSFADVAAAYDEGGFGSNGGKMGSFAQGSLRPDLDQAAFKTPIGKLSSPVCDQTGCYMLFVFAEQKKEGPAFSELRPQLLDAYYAERFEAETRIWTEQAKRRASIEIKLATP